MIVFGSHDCATKSAMNAFEKILRAATFRKGLHNMNMPGSASIWWTCSCTTVPPAWVCNGSVPGYPRNDRKVFWIYVPLGNILPLGLVGPVKTWAEFFEA